MSFHDMGRGIGALAQTIGRTGIPFLGIYVVPALKKVRVDLLETASLEIGIVLTGKLKIQISGRRCWNENITYTAMW